MNEYIINDGQLITVINQLRNLPVNNVEGLILQLQALPLIDNGKKNKQIGFQSILDEDIKEDDNDE